MSSSENAIGDLAIVLHAHLPYIRHPEYRYHLEENWLYEAVTATYLPLLDTFRRLAKDGVRFKVTITLSPPLVEMLRDDLLKMRTASYLDRLLTLGEQERRRTEGDATFHYLAGFYLERYSRLKALYDELRGDLVTGFRQLQDDGFLEIMTVAATHGFMPTIREPIARRAQIQMAARHHHQHFGRWPRGIWLPECGYVDGVEDFLAEAGLRYFLVDSHALLCGQPRPPFGVAAPVFTRAAVAAFGRDIESSKQVWSAQEGYPGDGVYREFYRDVGFDRPLEEIRPFIHPDGIRVNTGYKYFRVTGKVDLAHKEPYNPDWARERAATHAGNFVFNRQQQAKWLAQHMDRRPIIVSPYDAELFGHWWFEGPDFLELLFRKIHFDQQAIRLTTPADYLEEHPVNAVCQVAPSSWGDGGFSAVWIDGPNDWIYRHQHRIEARMIELARNHADGCPELVKRALNQAARELLLLQSSDWAFILKTGTATGYATARVKAHIARFRRIDRDITSGQIDEGWLADLERRDNVFSAIDYRLYAR
ncbi:MAG: 1,4-alpha-glucan branching protein domain-containing protein [Pseudomonadota bacterium]